MWICWTVLWFARRELPIALQDKQGAFMDKQVREGVEAYKHWRSCKVNFSGAHRNNVLCSKEDKFESFLPTHQRFGIAIDSYLLLRGFVFGGLCKFGLLTQARLCGLQAYRSLPMQKELGPGLTNPGTSCKKVKFRAFLKWLRLGIFPLSCTLFITPLSVF